MADRSGQGQSTTQTLPRFIALCAAFPSSAWLSLGAWLHASFDAIRGRLGGDGWAGWGNQRMAHRLITGRVGHKRLPPFRPRRHRFHLLSSSITLVYPAFPYLTWRQIASPNSTQTASTQHPSSTTWNPIAQMPRPRSPPLDKDMPLGDDAADSTPYGQAVWHPAHGLKGALQRSTPGATATFPRP
jgi:hypothetical protein